MFVYIVRMMKGFQRPFCNFCSNFLEYDKKINIGLYICACKCIFGCRNYEFKSISIRYLFTIECAFTTIKNMIVSLRICAIFVDTFERYCITKYICLPDLPYIHYIGNYIFIGLSAQYHGIRLWLKNFETLFW